MHVLIHCPRYAPLRKDLFNCIHDLYQNFKGLYDSHKFNYLLNSDVQIVKVSARFFYLASLVHSSVKDNSSMYVFPLCLSVCFCWSVSSVCLFACLLLLTNCNMSFVKIVNVSF